MMTTTQQKVAMHRDVTRHEDDDGGVDNDTDATTR